MMMDVKVLRSMVALSALAATWALVGCSSSGEDVRVTLCKDLAVELLGRPGSVAWGEVETEVRRAEQLIVRLRFEAADASGGRAEPMRAACYYRHNAVDETALTLADPLSAFSTSPVGMTLNDQAIRDPRLAQAIKRAMLKQGRELVERAQRGLQEAAEQAQRRLGE